MNSLTGVLPRLLLLAMMVGGALPGAAHGGAGEVELDVIVKDADPAPAGDGGFDLSFAVGSYPGLVIDNDAVVYFFATTTASKPGIWSGTGAFVDDIAVHGQILPGFQPSAEDCEGFGPGCGQIFNVRNAFHVTPPGEILVRVNRDDNLGRVAHLTGSSNADLAPLITDQQVANFPFTIGLQTEAGQYLIGSYAGTAPFGDPTGGLEDFAAALIGGPAPFIPDPITITEVFGTYGTGAGVSFGFNERGDKLFIAALSDGGEALYFDPAAAATASNLLARTGDSPAGIAGAAYTALTRTLTVGRTGNARVNDAGQGYFVAHWRDPDGGDGNNNLPRGGIWRFDNGGGPVLVMSEYLDPTFDATFNTSEFAVTAFESFSSPQVGPDGDVYFYANGRDASGGIPDTSDERVGLWRYSAATSEIELVLRVSTSDAPGSPLPDGPNVPGTPLPGGGNFTGFGFSLYGIDEHGHLVFDTSDGIYAEDPSGLRLVLKKGQGVEIASGDIRTVSTFRISNLSYVGDALMGYRSDRLALRARFTDGSSAILRTRFLPPPPPPRLIALEAIQVVQDWENSVSLYADKTTFVRAHLRADEPGLEKVILRVFDAAGDEMAFSPLPAEIPAGLAFVGPENVMKREAKWASANFTLPPAAVAKADRVQLRVEILDGDLDCTVAAGPVAKDCTTTLDFKQAHVPQIKLISLNWTDPVLGLRRVDRASRIDLIRRLVSAYPIAEVDWTDAEVPYSSVPDLKETLKEIQRLRTKDKCTSKNKCMRMYYGALRKHSVQGLAEIDGYAGTGYVDPNPRAQGRHTHTHEIGHNLDRQHSVADPAVISPIAGRLQGPCGSDAALSATPFPFMVELMGLGLRQVFGPLDQGEAEIPYGYDAMQGRVVDVRRNFDLMGYCSNDIIDLWPSVPTYDLIAAKLATRYPPPAVAPKGAPLDYWILSGTFDGDAIALDPLLLLEDALEPDVSSPGAYTVEVHDSAGLVLTSTSFEPDVFEARGASGGGRSFLVALPVQPNAARIEVLAPGGILAAVVVASASPPTVQIVAPNGGESIAGDSLDVSWNASDADGDPLTHTVQYSLDNGASWQTLVTDWPGQSLAVPAEPLAQSSQALIRVQTTDGFHIAEDVSDGVFTLPNSIPSVIILAPEDLRSYYANDAIRLDMAAFDSEDGPLDGSALSWISDIDGLLGQGGTLMLSASALTVGTHLVTAAATDSGDETGQAAITLTVDVAPPSPLADLAVDLFTDLAAPPPADEPHTLRVRVENQGPDAVNDASVLVSLALVDLATAPGAQGVIADFDAPPGWSCQAGAMALECTDLVLDAYVEAQIALDVLIDRPALATVTATIGSSVSDPAGASNVSSAEYLVGIAERIFSDGFERVPK